MYSSDVQLQKLITDHLYCFQAINQQHLHLVQNCGILLTWHVICHHISPHWLGPRVDILTSGHILLECRTRNIMHHMFCRITNCDKKITSKW